MPTRTLTCGECGRSQDIPNGDWNTVQKSQIEAWERQHELDVHDGKEVSAWELDPNPMRD